MNRGEDLVSDVTSAQQSVYIRVFEAHASTLAAVREWRVTRRVRQ